MPSPSALLAALLVCTMFGLGGGWFGCLRRGDVMPSVTFALNLTGDDGRVEVGAGVSTRGRDVWGGAACIALACGWAIVGALSLMGDDGGRDGEREEGGDDDDGGGGDGDVVEGDATAATAVVVAACMVDQVGVAVRLVCTFALAARGDETGGDAARRSLSARAGRNGSRLLRRGLTVLAAAAASPGGECSIADANGEVVEAGSPKKMVVL